MQIFNDLNKVDLGNRNAVTVGVYDGVHLGHQRVLKELVSLAKKIDGQSVLLTFEKHPRIVLGQTKGLKLLNTLAEKKEQLAKVGLDVLIVIPFTQEFANLSAQDFVRNVLVDKLHTKKLAIGFNHHFGKNREGSFEFLKSVAPEFDFEVVEIPAEDIEEVKVSSTKIRSALEHGELEQANLLLGRPYSVSGKVVSGDKIGRSIGFPTANIQLEDEFKLLPGYGAYAVNVIFDDQVYKGMLNIGQRPTVSNEKNITIEVNIFNFNREIYGNKIAVEFVSKIREEMAFADVNQLSQQLQRDKEQCLSIL